MPRKKQTDPGFKVVFEDNKTTVTMWGFEKINARRIQKAFTAVLRERKRQIKNALYERRLKEAQNGT